MTIRVKDISGNRYGSLVAIKRAPNNKRAVMWLCRCDCGIEKEISKYSLTSGITGTCGNHKISDISGRKFSRLTAISRIGNNQKGQSVWSCVCDCGKTINVTLPALITGNTKSCGCYKKDKSVRNLSGIRVGKLLIIGRAERPAHVKDSGAYWLCQCDCGNMTTVSSSSLCRKISPTYSCGCFNRERASIRMTANGNPNWIDGLSDEDRKSMVHPRREKIYLKWCSSVHKKCKYTCQLCGKIGNKIVAHHLNSWADNPSERYEVDNGVSLCERCHIDFHVSCGRGKNTREQFYKYKRDHFPV